MFHLSTPCSEEVTAAAAEGSVKQEASVMPKDARRKRAWLFLGPVLLLLALVLPAPKGMTPEAARLVGVTALMAVWWLAEVVNLAVVAMVPLVAFPLLGIWQAQPTARAYADQNIFLFMGGLLLASAMQRWGLHRRMAVHVLFLLGSRPRGLVLGFMAATGFLSMWISNTATAVMMLPIAVSVVVYVTGRNPEEIRGQRGEDRDFSLALMLGIAYGASIGGMATLVGTPPNIVLVGQMDQLFPGAPGISFARWMLLGLPLAAVFLPAVWFYLCWVAFPVKTLRIGKGRDFLRRERDALGPMDTGERATLVAFVTAALLWMTRQPLDLGGFRLPGWSTLLPWAGFIKDSTVAMAVALSLFFIPADRKEGTRVLNWQWASRIPWDVLILLGGGFALAGAFRTTGLSAWFAQRLIGMDALPPVVMVVVVCAMMTLLTELTSNTATAAVMLPILAATAVEIGVHPLVLMIPATLSASCAFMLPVATPPNAIMFGSGCLDIPTMAKTGIVVNLLGLILIALFLFTVGVRILGISPGTVPPWAVP
jgi:sodium-dependent dicarboxylate transporter 2/3/5